MFTLVPLADNEEIKFKNASLYLRSKECGKYNHIWFAEIGKLLYFKENYACDDSPFAFIQNRRFFKNLDQIKLKSKDEVILAPQEFLDHQSILTQFWFCHNEYFELYRKIVVKNFHPKLYNAYFMSPHNIFIGDIEFVKEYCHWLELNLVPYFNCNENKKYCAWMCERFLHLFANTYFKVKTYPIEILEK